jgi:hypothetical protein
MTKPSFRQAIFIVSLLGFTCFIYGQAKTTYTPGEIRLTQTKPFKLLTNNRQITIQSKQELKSLLVWTASGYRIVEQRELNSASYNFTVPAKENIIFLLIETVDGKRYTEKLGVR